MSNPSQTLSELYANIKYALSVSERVNAGILPGSSASAGIRVYKYMNLYVKHLLEYDKELNSYKENLKTLLAIVYNRLVDLGKNMYTRRHETYFLEYLRVTGEYKDLYAEYNKRYVEYHIEHPVV